MCAKSYIRYLELIAFFFFLFFCFCQKSVITRKDPLNYVLKTHVALCVAIMAA